MTSRIAGGSTRLPTCVTRIRSALRFMLLPPFTDASAAASRRLERALQFLPRDERCAQRRRVSPKSQLHVTCGHPGLAPHAHPEHERCPALLCNQYRRFMQQRGGGVELAGYGDDALMFELAPISLWLQDLSEVKALFADWRRSGGTRLQDFLLEDPERTRACWDRSRVLKVNKRTLALFEASDLQHLV